MRFTSEMELVLLGAMPLVVIGLSDTSVMFEADMMEGGNSVQSIGRGGHVERICSYVWQYFKAPQRMT